MSAIDMEKHAKEPAVQAAPVKQPKPINTGYGRYLWQGFIALFVLVVCIGGWAVLASIQGAVIASGVVVVEGKTKTLQHLDGGIVGEILVKNGDQVEAGDVMLRLDPTAMDANRTLIEKRLYQSQAQVDRLRAERDETSKITWSERIESSKLRPDVAEIISGQDKLFKARRKAFMGQAGQLRERIAQSREQIKGFGELRNSKRVQIDLISQELIGLQKLLVKGYVSKTRILALERELARLNGEMATHRSDIARTRSAISETEIQILQIQQDQEAQILTQLREVDGELSDLNEQFTTAADQRKRIDVTSPVAGIVHDLLVTTVGGVITPGQPMMQIIPSNQNLLIEARVITMDIDQVYEGQIATITLAAFNQRTTPQVDGVVIRASADSLADPVTGIPYFSVLIEIPKAEMKKLGGLTLRPGMPADAFLQTEKRTVMNYLLKPFTDQLNHTFREE